MFDVGSGYRFILNPTAPLDTEREVTSQNRGETAFGRWAALRGGVFLKEPRAVVEFGRELARRAGLSVRCSDSTYRRSL